ncbi:MAG: START-like domain-containing protein [Bacteroidaceae bacterium]
MEKYEKIHLEYFLKETTDTVIWEAIATPSGLSRWFADRVMQEGKTFLFYWGKEEYREAEMVLFRSGVFVRFHWLGEEPKVFFELRIRFNEMTHEITLEVTDFVPEGEVEEQTNLWNLSIDKLRQVYRL